MRTAISAIVALLCFASIPARAVAQSSSASTPPHSSVRHGATLMHKAPQPATTLPYDANLRDPLPSNIVDALNVLKSQTPDGNALGNRHSRIPAPEGPLHAEAFPPGTPCAHILIHHPKSMDSNAVATPNGSADHMPSVRGLPFCREDIR